MQAGAAKWTWSNNPTVNPGLEQARSQDPQDLFQPQEEDGPQTPQPQAEEVKRQRNSSAGVNENKNPPVQRACKFDTMPGGCRRQKCKQSHPSRSSSSKNATTTAAASVNQQPTLNWGGQEVKATHNWVEPDQPTPAQPAQQPQPVQQHNQAIQQQQPVIEPQSFNMQVQEFRPDQRKVVDDLKKQFDAKNKEAANLTGQLSKVQALNDQYKDWVKRLQDEKQESATAIEEAREDNFQLLRRVEQLEKANAALLARNKFLEVMGEEETQQEIQQTVSKKMNRQKERGSLTVVKNNVPEEYEQRIATLKQVLQKSNLNVNNMRKVEHQLRDSGADYFSIVRNDTVQLKNYGQFDLIWKYHGAGEDFVVYIDFD